MVLVRFLVNHGHGSRSSLTLLAPPFLSISQSIADFVFERSIHLLPARVTILRCLTSFLLLGAETGRVWNTRQTRRLESLLICFFFVPSEHFARAHGDAAMYLLLHAATRSQPVGREPADQQAIGEGRRRTILDRL